MELRVLNYFMTVAREKTISKAAGVLHLSQPTLSKQLKELEEELGVVLFSRGNREITLTDEGYYLMNKGKEILSLVNATTANLSEEKVITGEIAIGSGETNGMRLMGTSIKEMHKKYPDIKINIYSGNSDDVLEKLDRGVLDFCLVVSPVEKHKYEYITLPYHDTWGILLQLEHPLAAKSSLSPQDVEQFSLFLSNQSLVNYQLSKWLGKDIEELTILGTYNLLYNAALMVQEGIGAALCIDGVINTQGSPLVFIPLKPQLNASIRIIWKKNSTFSHAAKVFHTLLKKSYIEGLD